MRVSIKALDVNFGENIISKFQRNCTLELKCKMSDGDWFENQFEETSCNFSLRSRSIVPVCGKSDCRLPHVFIAVTRFSLGPHLRFLFPLSVFFCDWTKTIRRS